MKRLLLLIIILLSGITNQLISQPRISYIIPDIGAPGMNVYIEVICPFDPDNMSLSANNFYMDGFYYNNPGDQVRLECVNPSDAQKIIFGPLIVSWGGRMISSQVFVHPDVKPNSWNWEQLSVNFRIPIRVTVMGIQSNIDTFYIVNAFQFGDKSGSADRVFGQGQLGKRSRRGAMVVDSMILANATYTVSTADCDPSTPANEGFLPFVLLSKGKALGGANTIISADGEITAGGHGGNGGPGGGGGGGRFCDVNFSGSAGDDGGNGFTGGGMGGENRVTGGGSLKAVGIGTGSNPSRGYSLNGIYPPKHDLLNLNTWEASGGGTGHPFGMPGIGTGDGYNDNPIGGYGGGSGQTQKMNGGSGGYGTNGVSSKNSNGGKIHGNKMVVPIAGGSGGASGNPQKLNPFTNSECSGSGGGGGGAIRLYAPLITNVKLQANGGDGHTGDNGADGGGGSGGSVSMHSRIGINGGGGTTAGGAVVQGGAGRIRNDYPIWNFGPVTNPAQATTYRGPTTDTSNYVKRQFTLTGSRNVSENVHFYIKPESGVWQEIIQAISPTDRWNIPMDLQGNDSLYFFAVTQEITSPYQNMNEHLWDPNAIMSQSAANIFRIFLLPLIDSDTLITFRIVGCEGNTHDDTVLIKNIGKANLVLRMDSSGFKNPGSGFSLVSPTNIVSVVPAGTQQVIVRYTYQPGQRGIIRDTLLIYNNDYESRYKPWEIAFEVNIDSVTFDLYDIVLQKQINTIDFGKVCVGDIKDTTFALRNFSSIAINLNNPTFTPINDYSGGIIGKRNVPVLDSSTLYISFKPTSEGIITSKYYIWSTECLTIVDSLLLTGEGVKADLSYSNDVIFTDVKVGTRDTLTTNLKNNGTSDALITNLPNLNPPFKVLYSIPAVPVLLKKGESIEVYVEYAPIAEGIDSAVYFTNSVMQGNSCIDTAFVNIKGNSVKPLIELNKYSIDYGLLSMCQTKLDTIIITNKGSGSVNITSRGKITGTNPSFFRINNEPVNVPYTLQPNASSMYIIEFIPAQGASGIKNADFSVTTDEPSTPEITVPLTGKSDSIRVTAPVLIDFGGVPIGNVRNQTVTLTNNSELNVNVIRVESDNPNVTVTPQTASITANGGTADFNVSMNFVNGGPLTAKLNFIIDIPCADTVLVNVKGEGLVGNIENTASLNYGILAPCEDSVMTVTVTNTGTAPILVLPTPYLRGSDKSLFNILDTNSYPLVLNPGDTCYINVQFIPTGSTDGVKQAELAIPVFMNNDTVEVSTVLRGDRRSGIVLVPNQIIFGSITTGTTAGRNLVLKNIGTLPVTITSIPLNGYFKIIPAPMPPTTLQPGDSLVLRIEFTPDSIRYYEDTLHFGIQVLSCNDMVSVLVSGNGSPAKTVHVWMPHMVDVPPDQTGYRIPVFGRLGNVNETLTGSSLTADIAMDSTLFFPVSLTKGNILSIGRNLKNIVVSIEINNVDLNANDSLLTEIIGYTLLGDTTYTDLSWMDFKWTGGETMNSPTTENGSLEIKICRRGQNRLLKHGNPITMTIASNPATDAIIVDISVLETGKYNLELMDLTGGINLLKNWDVYLNSNMDYRFDLDIGNISSGIYYLILKTPSNYKVVPVLVVK